MSRAGRRRRPSAARPDAQVVLDADTRRGPRQRHARSAQLGVPQGGRRPAVRRAAAVRRPVDLRPVVAAVLASGEQASVQDVRWPRLDAGRPVVGRAGRAAAGGRGAARRDRPLRRRDALPRAAAASSSRAHTELQEAYEELQSSSEELETTNEELQSAIEELETTNEELHSTNEELETMNEELQSTNEELQTVNDELRERTGEVGEVNAFLESVLGSLRHRGRRGRPRPAGPGVERALRAALGPAGLRGRGALAHGPATAGCRSRRSPPPRAPPCAAARPRTARPP